jgi:hypothetical protein
MNSDESIVLRLEVDRHADPITGTVTQGDQVVHPFTGWLALTDAIESIRAVHAEAHVPVGDMPRSALADMRRHGGNFRVLPDANQDPARQADER